MISPSDDGIKAGMPKANGKYEAGDVSFQKVTIVGAMSLVLNRAAICLAVV